MKNECYNIDNFPIEEARAVCEWLCGVCYDQFSGIDYDDLPDWYFSTDREELVNAMDTLKRLAKGNGEAL